LSWFRYKQTKTDEAFVRGELWVIKWIIKAAVAFAAVVLVWDLNNDGPLMECLYRAPNLPVARVCWAHYNPINGNPLQILAAVGGAVLLWKILTALDRAAGSK
jgi:hypothetical protein